MDAVLHPAIYSHPEIFFQEGWHYELDKDGSIVYKGVVLNEIELCFLLQLYSFHPYFCL